MKSTAWIAVLLAILFAAPTEARSRCDKLECDEIKTEIREIQSRMRSGYTRAQGERYEARLRKLKTRRRHVCR